jgi:hypothetical protein
MAWAALPIAAAALGAGFWLDAQPALTQPKFFWSFLGFGVAGAALGVGWRARLDPSPLRRLLAVAATLVAWRVSYFPLTVICGWQASLGEWALHAVSGRSVILSDVPALDLRREPRDRRHRRGRRDRARRRRVPPAAPAAVGRHRARAPRRGHGERQQAERSGVVRRRPVARAAADPGDPRDEHYLAYLAAHRRLHDGEAR